MTDHTAAHAGRRLVPAALPAIATRATCCYCASGNRSGQVAALMDDAGFSAVYDAGGFSDLADAGVPTST